ncbi:MAG: hypothetical protein ABIH46_08970 [Chloroflexota bacterium]
MSHTPPPYYTYEDDMGRVIITAEEGVRDIAVMLLGDDRVEQEDAAFIIQACNSYDALLERLSAYVEWHEAAVPEAKRDDYEKEYLLEGAKAIIAQAVIQKAAQPTV